MAIDSDHPLLKRRRTKIVATVGPASASIHVLESLIRAGVNVFRLNMSHGTHEGHRTAYESIRRAAAECGIDVGILADLCGPKIRCGTFENGSIEVETGSSVVVTTRDVVGGPGLIPSQYEQLDRDARPGARILLDDGNLELQVEKVEGTEITCRVIQGGTLKNRKGMNLPDVQVSAPSLTEKDRDDARFCLGLGVDFLALSFVRRASDIEDLREVMQAEGSIRAAIIAKIEKPEALAEIDAILQAADGVMVARGDLGVEMPPEMVPIIQSELIDRARAHCKPVIVATQMLESMIGNSRPTRAEVSDVSTAVTAGADAVMLSAETASGAFPVRAVETMDRVARRTEAYLWKKGGFSTILERGDEPSPPIPIPDAVTRATSRLSRDLMVRAIFVISRTGLTARLVSSARPAAPVVAVSPDERALRTMHLLWGVVPTRVDSLALDQPESLARSVVAAYDLASPGECILRVSGFHADQDLSTPTISVVTI